MPRSYGYDRAYSGREIVLMKGSENFSMSRIETEMIKRGMIVGPNGYTKRTFILYRDRVKAVIDNKKIHKYLFSMSKSDLSSLFGSPGNGGNIERGQPIDTKKNGDVRRHPSHKKSYKKRHGYLRDKDETRSSRITVIS